MQLRGGHVLRPGCRKPIEISFFLTSLGKMEARGRLNKLNGKIDATNFLFLSPNLTGVQTTQSTEQQTKWDKFSERENNQIPVKFPIRWTMKPTDSLLQCGTVWIKTNQIAAGFWNLARKNRSSLNQREHYQSELRIASQILLTSMLRNLHRAQIPKPDLQNAAARRVGLNLNENMLQKNNKSNLPWQTTPQNFIAIKCWIVSTKSENK